MACYSVTLLHHHLLIVNGIRGKETPLPKLLTVTTSGCTDHCKMGNAGSVDNGGQVELRQDMKDEANQLKEEYDQLREGKERLSITHLRKSLKRQQSTDKKTLSEEEDKLKQMFSNKKDLNFTEYPKDWKTLVPLSLFESFKQQAVAKTSQYAFQIFY